MLLKTLFITFFIWFIPSTNCTVEKLYMMQQPNVVTHAIQFIEQDWNLAKQQAKEANKLIFVDVYATWCGPCKMLQQRTFTNAKVAEFLNTHFINLSIDAEKTIGPQVARYFGVTAYPTLVFTDASGKPVLYTMGYMGPKAFLKFANVALTKAKK